MKKTISLLIAVAMLLAMLPVFSVAAADDLLSDAGSFDSDAFGNTVAYDATVDHNGAEDSGSMKLSSSKSNHAYVYQTAKASTIYTATFYVLFEAGEFEDSNQGCL